MTIPNTTHRLLVEKLGGTDPAAFIGNEGEVFYDPDAGSPTLRLSDGSTAGGIEIGGSGSGGIGVTFITAGSGISVDQSVGNVTITATGVGITIGNLDDVDTTTVSPSTGDILTWDGSSWVPNNPNTQSLPAGTLILAHFDGTNGSTYTVEDGPYSRSVAIINGATLSTSNSKFGGSSLQLNGSSHQGISISPPEAFGTGDFSIDLWVYYDGTQPNGFPTICNLSGDLEIGVNAGNGGVYATLYDRSGSFVGESWTGAGAINNNLWNHIAVQCASGTTQLWVNGVAAPSFTATLDYTAALLFGTFTSSTGGLNGYIDEIRITNTTPYTIGSNFTPPTSAYS